jgi:hypothetical protein
MENVDGLPTTRAEYDIWRQSKCPCMASSWVKAPCLPKMCPKEWSEHDLKQRAAKAGRVPKGGHWFKWSYNRYDSILRTDVRYCGTCNLPRGNPEHFAQDHTSNIPRYKAGDVVQAKDGSRRYEIVAVGLTTYFTRSLFSSSGEPTEASWAHEGMDQATELEWSKGPSPVSIEMDRIQSVQERVKLALQQWKRGDRRSASTLWAIYDEVIRSIPIPLVEELEYPAPPVEPPQDDADMIECECGKSWRGKMGPGHGDMVCEGEGE